ncbi:MAG: hypothetical protein U0R50_03445 [Gaiellales bacterium]
MRQASHTTRITGIGAMVLALVGAIAAVLVLPAGGAARSAAAPVNTAEPTISGSAAVASTLTASRGSWTNNPTSYGYQWVRCGSNGGKSDGSDCAAISGASTTSYVVGSGDVNRRLRIRITASNADGSRTAASNPTALISSTTTGKPVNRVRPTLSGTTVQDETLHVVPGTWSGRQPITFTFNWLRCDSAGNNCIVQPGFTDDSYTLRPGDIDRTMRARVNADNGDGQSSSMTLPSARIVAAAGPPGMIVLPNGEKSIPTTSIPADQRLVVDQVAFSPGVIRSRTDPITVRIKVKDTRGYVVRDAEVFFRSTPLVTRNPQNQRTGQDGWLQLQTLPERDFPELRGAYSVQFFVKVGRTGDPELGGISGSRLVQVPLSR